MIFLLLNDICYIKLIIIVECDKFTIDLAFINEKL